MSALITGHVYRPFRSDTLPHHLPVGSCSYMSCGRPRAEHAQQQAGRHIPAPKVRAQ